MLVSVPVWLVQQATAMCRATVCKFNFFAAIFGSIVDSLARWASLA